MPLPVGAGRSVLLWEAVWGPGDRAAVSIPIPAECVFPDRIDAF